MAASIPPRRPSPNNTFEVIFDTLEKSNSTNTYGELVPPHTGPSPFPTSPHVPASSPRRNLPCLRKDITIFIITLALFLTGAHLLTRAQNFRDSTAALQAEASTDPSELENILQQLGESVTALRAATEDTTESIEKAIDHWNHGQTATGETVMDVEARPALERSITALQHFHRTVQRLEELLIVVPSSPHPSEKSTPIGESATTSTDAVSKPRPIQHLSQEKSHGTTE